MKNCLLAGAPFAIFGNMAAKLTTKVQPVKNQIILVTKTEQNWRDATIEMKHPGKNATARV